MCGLAGFIDFARSSDPSKLAREAQAMADRLRHRGPDGQGVWVDAESGVALGHTRLSILDLTPTGKQPMVSKNGRIVAVYNGEIYNHLELRSELESQGSVFSGHSDTEVLVEAFAAWGRAKTLNRLNGMFAAAVWDREARSLALMRDPLGQKPLYYASYGRFFVFGSEIKAIRAHRSFNDEIDRESLTAYVGFGYVPSPRSIFRGLSKLEPGECLVVSENGALMREFHRLPQIDAGRADAYRSFDDLKARFQSVLRDALHRHLISDVPIATLMSGGIDSSLITAAYRQSTTRPIRCFVVRFDDPAMDESAYARAVGAALGCEVEEMTVDEGGARALIPNLPEIYDEPFADSSQVPTALIARLVSTQAKVVLSGDGADELFGGYERYRAGLMIASRMKMLPRGARNVGAHLLERAANERYQRVASTLFLHSPFKVDAHRLGKAAELLRQESFLSAYRSMVMQWSMPEAVVKDAKMPPTLFDGEDAILGPSEPLSLMQELDLRSYLPDDLMVKTDRAAMAAGLEIRMPYLDREVVAFARHLPRAAKYEKGRGKMLLRALLSDYLPGSLVERPKQGFSAPIAAWLRGGLRDWAEELLSERRIRAEGYFEPEPIRERWHAHQAGKRDYSQVLWTILMFQQWLQSVARVQT